MGGWWLWEASLETGKNLLAGDSSVGGLENSGV